MVIWDRDRAQLHNELQALADVRTAAHDQDWTGTVAERWSPAVMAAQDALRARIVAAGYSEAHASQAVTSWVLMGGAWTVLQAIDRTNADGPV